MFIGPADLRVEMLLPAFGLMRSELRQSAMENTMVSDCFDVKLDLVYLYPWAMSTNQ